MAPVARMAMRVHLRVLGVPVLQRFRGRTARGVYLQSKRLALLAYLALASRRAWCRRDTLVGLLWPECDEHRARNALSQALHQLRRALGSGVLATRGDEEIAVSCERLWCDAAALDDALAAGRHEEALELYRGPLLDGVHVAGAPAFDEWLQSERERWRVRAAEAASMLARAAQAQGLTSRAVRWLKRLLDLSPDDESAIRQLMAVRRTTGDPAAALREYREFERRLFRELDAEPAPETRLLAERIRKEVNAGARTLRPDSPAYDAYWRGLVHWSRRTPEDVRKAAARFREAIDRDPECAQVYAAFAMAASALGAGYYDVDAPHHVYPGIKEALTKALAIDANIPEALASLAVVLALYDRNWAEAEAASLRACALAPDEALVQHARAVVTVYSGRIGEALAAIDRAATLEPLALGYQEIKCWYLYLACRHQEAIRQLKRLLDLEPRLYLARLALGHAHAALGQAAEAEAAYRSATDAVGRHPYPMTALGVLFARTGRRADASRVLDELAALGTTHYVRPTYFAAVHAALGDHDAALRWLGRAIDERDSHVGSVVLDPFFDPLRVDPRFPGVLTRIGLGTRPGREASRRL